MRMTLLGQCLLAAGQKAAVVRPRMDGRMKKERSVGPCVWARERRHYLTFPMLDVRTEE